MIKNINNINITMNVRYYLQRPKEMKSLIQVSASWKGNRLQLSSGISIPTKNWNSKREALKSSAEGALEINLYLENLKTMLAQYYLKAQGENKALTKSEVRQKIKEYINPEKNLKKRNMMDIFQIFIDNREASHKFKKRTIQKFESSLNHLKEFKKDTGYEISFENMNEEFCDKFMIYLTENKGLVNNTARTVIRNTKTFLLDALDKGLTKEAGFIKGFNKSLKNFKTKKESQSVALTEEELQILEKIKLEKNKLKTIRDLFLLQIYTGMRFSDLDNLKPENILLKENVIQITTMKTEEPILIPIHKKLKKILKKYPGRKLPKYSNQKYNDYIKELCKKAEIDDTVQVTNFIGKRREEIVYKKYELISSHTARRTFITLLLKKGVLPEHVMKISGHQSRAAFQKYVRLTQTEALDAVKGAWE